MTEANASSAEIWAMTPVGCIDTTSLLIPANIGVGSYPYYRPSFIVIRVKEIWAMSQKKTPVLRFFLRVVDTTGARGNSLRSNKSACFFPVASPMLGAEQRDKPTNFLQSSHLN